MNSEEYLAILENPNPVHESLLEKRLKDPDAKIQSVFNEEKKIEDKKIQLNEIENHQLMLLFLKNTVSNSVRIRFEIFPYPDYTDKQIETVKTILRDELKSEFEKSYQWYQGRLLSGESIDTTETYDQFMTMLINDVSEAWINIRKKESELNSFNFAQWFFKGKMLEEIKIFLRRQIKNKITELKINREKI